MEFATSINLQDVAPAAGVSLATVDRVLHGHAGVCAHTVERVDKVVRRLGYRPDLAVTRLAGLYSIGAGNRGIQAALLASGRIKHVGWVCHKLTPYARSAPVGRTCAARTGTHSHRHLPQGQPAVKPRS